MILSGAAAGADLIVFETMTDLYEVKAGVLAAKENCSLPVFVTMTFESSGRTFTGCSVEAMACTLEGLGVDALGINCSLGPDEIFPIARKLAFSTDLPLIVKANAGLPDPETETYDVTPAEFAESMKRYREIGLKFTGGCLRHHAGIYRRAMQSAEKLRRGIPVFAEEKPNLYIDLCCHHRRRPRHRRADQSYGKKTI